MKRDNTNMEAAFIEAALAGDIDGMDALITAGVDVNYIDPVRGYNALHIASGRTHRAGLLLLAGTGRCDFSLKDQSGRTAAHIAYGQDAYAIGRWLLKRQYAPGAQPV